MRTVAHMLFLEGWWQLLKGSTGKEEQRLMGVGQRCCHWYLPKVCRGPCPICEGEDWITLLRCGEEEALAFVMENSSKKGPSLLWCGSSLGGDQCLGE